MDSQSPKIDYTVLGDGYVLIYNKNKNKFVFVDPDEVLKKSAEDVVIPQEFIDELGDNLDNKIDIDSGTFWGYIFNK